MLFRSKLRKFGYSIAKMEKMRRKALYNAISSIGKIGVLGELQRIYEQLKYKNEQVFLRRVVQDFNWLKREINPFK